jgi:hypothetical protein
MFRARLSLFEFESRANPDASVPHLPPVGGAPLPPPVDTVVIQPPAVPPATPTGTIGDAAHMITVTIVNSTDPFLGINPITGQPFIQ